MYPGFEYRRYVFPPLSFFALSHFFLITGVTYFASIFIIATAVTELEFLHILAAIIRGDKNYFDFRREFLTREEALQKSRQDSEVEGDQQKPDTPSVPTPAKPIQVPRRFGGSSMAATALRLEERALDWLEKKLRVTIQRYVRFKDEASFVELDGIVQERGKPDCIIEIKWIRNPAPQTGFYSRIADQVTAIFHRYKSITKREPELVLLLIVPAPIEVPKALITQLEHRLSSAGVKNRILVVTYAELNVEDAPEGSSVSAV